MPDRSEFRPNLDIFGVPRRDAGWLYVFQNSELLKVGKTKNPQRRIKEARTWLPDLKIIAMKPFWNITAIERTLHEGCAQYWHSGEWFCIEPTEDRTFFLEGFCEFYDSDRDMNSVDFIYWWNSSGFAEFSIERQAQGLSLRKWKLCRAYPS